MYNHPTLSRVLADDRRRDMLKAAQSRHVRHEVHRTRRTRGST